MRESPIGHTIPYNSRIYRPWAEHVWRHYCAGEFILIDTVDGAYIKDIEEAKEINWPPDSVLDSCDIWVILFDRGSTIGCLN